MDPGLYPQCYLLTDFHSVINPLYSFSVGFLIEAIILFALLLFSGFISGAETAFFSITPAQLVQLKESEHTSSTIVARLLDKPKRLLATLLISINFANIAIVVLSSLMISEVFDFHFNPLFGFLIQIVAVTFIIVLFCEVMPKVYATQNAWTFSHLSAIPVFLLDKGLRPFTSILVMTTTMVEKRIHIKGYDVSVDELTHAIDITSDKNTPEEEKKILKGIARFGDIDVKQIMKPRMDVLAFDKKLKFAELFPLILENRYSRIPVFEESFDTVTGVLYIKDLLPYLDRKNNDSFDWIKLVRPAYFVPESKKINDLLQEFQERKIHLAIVIDEYGGTSGIVTLEDILEEIVGEINDEFDEEEVFYSKLDDKNFVFEGKTLLNDVCRVMEIDRKLFEIDKEEIDTLAGFLLELRGSIPQRNEVITHNNLKFLIESADRRRIKRVKITLPEDEDEPDGGIGSNISSLMPILLLFAFLSSVFVSCDEDFVPKPRGYFRITMPERKYVPYDGGSCPFSFDIPSYARIVPDTNSLSEPCWMNLEFPYFSGTLYISYKPVQGNLLKYIEDSRAMAMKHIPKASGIEQANIDDPNHHVYGLYYYVKGNAASPVQFFVTDSTSHFLRASLYFYSLPNPDSIQPALQFVEQDIRHMVNTIRWK